MSKQAIAPGKYVSLSYTIGDGLGSVLEQHDIPVHYIYGGEQELIGGMDRAVLGKCAGDVIELEVPPEEGFGPHDPSLTFTDDLQNVPPQFRHVGAQVQMQNESGDVREFYVREIRDGKLTVDGNHPLAGKTLHVKVVIHEVRDATPQDYAGDGNSCTIN